VPCKHGDRPALIYVVSGRIYEHGLQLRRAALLQGGEVARERRHVALVEERGHGKVVLAVVDIHARFPTTTTGAPGPSERMQTRRGLRASRSASRLCTVAIWSRTQAIMPRSLSPMAASRHAALRSMQHIGMAIRAAWRWVFGALIDPRAASC